MQLSNTDIYRGMNRAALDAAYNNGLAVKDSPEWLERWQALSAKARSRSDAKLDIAYGTQARQKLDLFPSGRDGSPLFVFIHGGYWQRNDKEMFSFVSEGLAPLGIDTAVVGYTLAPEATLTQIVAEMRSALSFLEGHGEDLGYDGSRICVGGWSAGGHLTAMVSDHPAVRAAFPISGIFELEPMALCYINDKLRLTQKEVETLSPARLLPRDQAPMRMFAGGNELPELVRQSRDYAAALEPLGGDVRLEIVAGRHHYSILDELREPGGLIASAIAKTLRG
ncbi:MAG: alpha/beta hydrolase [Hyphomicrobiales bacterium]